MHKTSSNILQSRKDICERFWKAAFLRVFLWASRLAYILRVCDGWAQSHVKIHRRGVAKDRLQ